METTRLIGQECTYGNVLSLLILIGREAYPYFIDIARPEYRVYVVVIVFATVFGGDSEEGTPVPIPNTEVKLFSADGTAHICVGE